MEMLGHTYIDVLKIDCEGCEYEVLPSVLNQMRKPFGQVGGWVWDGRGGDETNSSVG